MDCSSPEWLHANDNTIRTAIAPTKLVTAPEKMKKIVQVRQIHGWSLYLGSDASVGVVVVWRYSNRVAIARAHTSSELTAQAKQTLRRKMGSSVRCCGLWLGMKRSLPADITVIHMHAYAYSRTGAILHLIAVSRMEHLALKHGILQQEHIDVSERGSAWVSEITKIVHHHTLRIRTACKTNNCLLWFWLRCAL